jgi:hypothetical protein
MQTWFDHEGRYPTAPQKRRDDSVKFDVLVSGFNRSTLTPLYLNGGLLQDSLSEHLKKFTLSFPNAMSPATSSAS